MSAPANTTPEYGLAQPSAGQSGQAAYLNASTAVVDGLLAIQNGLVVVSAYNGATGYTANPPTACSSGGNVYLCIAPTTGHAPPNSTYWLLVGPVSAFSSVRNPPWVVGTQAAMLALSSAVIGDVCVRTDIAETFVLSALPATTLGNWVQLLFPTGAVSSVDGLVGAVSLAASYAALVHAARHGSAGADPITPAAIGAPAGALVTSVGSPGADTNIPSEKAVRSAISTAGGGNVTGPGSSTVGHLAAFTGTDGTAIGDAGAGPLALANLGGGAETVGGSAANGSAATAARSDHKHAITQAAGNAGRWVGLIGGTDFTTTPASTSTITMLTDQTANIQPGMALQFVVGGNTFYCQCMAITSALLTVRGTTLGASALTSLAYDSLRQTAEATILIGTAWTSTGVSLNAALGQYLSRST